MSLKSREQLKETYEIILSETAIDSFEAIFDQIQARWGDRIATKFENKVTGTLALLAKRPLIFKSIEAQSNVRKGFIDKNCSFFYEISSEQVQILFFWDNRQEPLFE
jgi:plasmid stabilization system protein ParE